MFNKIYIVCPTYAEDKVWGPLDNYVLSGHIELMDKVNENKLKQIWNECRQRKREGDDQFQTLIYFDDCGGQEDFKRIDDKGIINQLATKGNHSNISCIYVVQRVVFCSPTMRVNAQYILIFYTQNESERKRIYEEYGIGSFKNFSALLRLSTLKPYDTLFIDRRGPGEPLYYHNFKLIKHPENITHK